jgi:Pacifastin inhibitor (LCMII)
MIDGRARALVVSLVGVALAMLAACKSSEDGCEWKGHHHAIGEIFPDDCNTCGCHADGVSCTLVACPPSPDASPGSCRADNVCPSGPACGEYCCNAGEHCDNGACRCGSNPGCGTGGTCGGPAMTGACGSLCCPKDKPCPL